MPKNNISGRSFLLSLGLRIVSLALAVTLVISSGMMSYASAGAITVKIVDGLKRVSVTTNATDPAQIISEAGFILSADDEMDVSRFSETEGGTITINRARLLRYEKDGKSIFYFGSDNDSAAGKSTAGKADSVKSFIKRASTVTVDADGSRKKIAVSGGTVRDALKKAGISVSKSDSVFPSLDSPAFGLSLIKVTRVRYRQRTEKEAIPYEVKTLIDPSLRPGEFKVISEGKNGEKKTVYLDKYVNGELDSSSVIRETVISKPQEKTVKAGAAKYDALSNYDGNSLPISELRTPESLKIGEDGAPLSYKKCIKGKATAYTGDPITATGTVPKPGSIAVDPNMIPYGSKCYVVSADGRYVYGYCIAEDTGGFVKMGNTTIDLFMNNEQMCDDWGNRRVNIYIL